MVILMKKVQTSNFPKKPASVISLLLAIAVVATTTAYLIYKFASNKAYRRKWKDYDECGLA